VIGVGKHLTFATAVAGLLGCTTLVTGAPPHVSLAVAAPPPSRPTSPATPSRPTTIVLVAIDGARWQEIFQGTDRRLLDEAGLDAAVHARTAEQLVPHLAALARSGVALGAPGHGAPFLASGPNFVSLPGYTELLSGHPAACQENDCEPPDGTLFDAVFTDPRGAPAPSALIASWDRLAAFAPHVPASVLVSAGKLGPVPRASVASLDALDASLDASESGPHTEVGSGDYRSDLHTRAVALT
jgi:hypothetical protein